MGLGPKDARLFCDGSPSEMGARGRLPPPGPVEDPNGETTVRVVVLAASGTVGGDVARLAAAGFGGTDGLRVAEVLDDATEDESPGRLDIADLLVVVAVRAAGAFVGEEVVFDTGAFAVLVVFLRAAEAAGLAVAADVLEAFVKAGGAGLADPAPTAEFTFCEL